MMECIAMHTEDAVYSIQHHFTLPSRFFHPVPVYPVPIYPTSGDSQSFIANKANSVKLLNMHVLMTKGKMPELAMSKLPSK